MKITRKRLRKLIIESLGDTTNDMMLIIQNLNSLIFDAKNMEEEFRATRVDVHKQSPEHIQNTWEHIELLINSLGLDKQSPKEASIHYVVDAEEGEILASYLTYDQAVEFGLGLGMVPVDGFEGQQTNVPGQEGRRLYFADDYREN